MLSLRITCQQKVKDSLRKLYLVLCVFHRSNSRSLWATLLKLVQLGVRDVAYANWEFHELDHKSSASILSMSEVCFRNSALFGHCWRTKKLEWMIFRQLKLDLVLARWKIDGPRKWGWFGFLFNCRVILTTVINRNYLS